MLYTYQIDYRKLFYSFLVVLFFLIISYRVYSCFQVPRGTTDVLRNLGYAAHAMAHNFSIYKTKGLDFKPESWTVLPWADLTFPYPPVTLIFFYIFSIFHLGIFWVKLALTLIDLASAYLFFKHVSKIAAILFFCAPVSLVYTSYEGQFEALLTLFMLLTALSVRDKHWYLAGFLFALSIQVKQFAILMAPWIVYQIWREQISYSFTSTLLKILLGIVLGFLPFLGYYIQKPDLLLIPFSTLNNLSNDNVFTWNFISYKFAALHKRLWYSLLTYAMLGILLYSAILGRKKIRAFLAFTPLSSFLFVIKSLKVARFWYLISIPGFLFCFLERKKLIFLLLVIYFILLLPHTIFGLTLGTPIDWPLTPQEFSVMKPCMFVCHIQE